MGLQFYELPPDKLQTAFEQGALQRGTNAVVLEKDYWVCFMLKLLFEQAELRDAIVFKGGTSLSKVFGVIDRFSEDIDISLSPSFLNYSEDVLDKNQSRTQRDKRLKELEKVCGDAILENVRPLLEIAVSAYIGKGNWLTIDKDVRTACPVILFHYPSHVSNGFSYLRRSVKLEFGSLTDQRPKGRYPVIPWIADHFPALFSNWECTVTTLEVERSFWEKATILHAEYHRPPEKNIPLRYSRHYSDLAALLRSECADSAIANTELRDDVRDWKARFFASSTANYQSAVPGSYRILPPDFRLPELRHDYEQMRDMFMSEPLSFDEILRDLEQLERRINE